MKVLPSRATLGCDAHQRCSGKPGYACGSVRLEGGSSSLPVRTGPNRLARLGSLPLPQGGVHVAVFGMLGASGAGATGNRVLTVYSVATGVQYINTADDRARGHVNNPLDPAPTSWRRRAPAAGTGLSQVTSPSMP